MGTYSKNRLKYQSLELGILVTTNDGMKTQDDVFLLIGLHY